jgi:hypothetical protein
MVVRKGKKGGRDLKHEHVGKGQFLAWGVVDGSAGQRRDVSAASSTQPRKPHDGREIISMQQRLKERDEGGLYGCHRDRGAASHVPQTPIRNDRICCTPVVALSVFTKCCYCFPVPKLYRYGCSVRC